MSYRSKVLWVGYAQIGMEDALCAQFGAAKYASTWVNVVSRVRDCTLCSRNNKIKVTQTSHLNLGCDARIYAIFRLCLKLCFQHPFSGTVPTYMLLVAVLGSKRPRQVPTATCVPYKGCGKYSLFHNIEIAYILAISLISKCEVWVR